MKSLSATSPLLALLLAPSLSAQVWEVEPLAVQSVGANQGFVVESAGDLDGDGLADGLVTNIVALGGRGRVTVVSSAGGGILLELNGSLAGDNLGHSAVGVGDMDGDGTGDILAGAPVLAGVRSGSVTLYSGASGQPIWTLDGEAPGDAFGWVVAATGDVNGDGIADVAVGAPGHDQPFVDCGKAYVYSGLDGSPIFAWEGLAAGDNLGASVGSAGDRDGDGRSEVLACAVRGGPSDAGEAYVFAGLDGGLLCTLTSPPAGKQYGNYFGGCAGDVDADGIDDVYVIDYLHINQRGRIYVYSGADCSLIHAIRGPKGSSFLFGRVRIGDLDGDGHDDLLLGSAANSTGGAGAGAVYLYSGASGDLMGQYNADGAGIGMGTDCASVGDIDGDGLADILVGVGQVPGGQGGVFFLPTQPAPPRVVCQSEPNSSGLVGSIGYSGSLSLGLASFGIALGQAPAGEPAVVFGGPNGARLPFGNGTRCVADPLARVGSLMLDGLGAGSLVPDLSHSGSAAVVLGQPWLLQGWFRDTATGGFNTTDALEVTFRP